IIAIILGCIALANPRKPDENNAGARKGIDIVIALDISNSMNATDVSPTRLGKAKQFISRLMENLTDDRVGLVVFAGNAYEQMPLTFDQQAASMYVASADPRQINIQGTSLSDALNKSSRMFNGPTQRFRTVILITDGETHDQNAMQTAQELAKTGIMISTIGIGSAEGATVPDSSGHPKTDAGGQVVISKLNEQLLQQIAAATNGKYIHLEGSDIAVKEVLSQFSQIEKKALGDSSLYTYKNFYAWLAIPMLLLLITEIFLPDSKKLRI
ncbi:MAG TPA: VWA domain-containing protein, partial [Flavisolibacter sp.]|nr:VWA domain-containing protein [Flavisolibacter sp.]